MKELLKSLKKVMVLFTIANDAPLRKQGYQIVPGLGVAKSLDDKSWCLQHMVSGLTMYTSNTRKDVLEWVYGNGLLNGIDFCQTGQKVAGLVKIALKKQKDTPSVSAPAVKCKRRGIGSAGLTLVINDEHPELIISTFGPAETISVDLRSGKASISPDMLVKLRVAYKRYK